jgi:hypothetical protein
MVAHPPDVNSVEIQYRNPERARPKTAPTVPGTHTAQNRAPSTTPLAVGSVIKAGSATALVKFCPFAPAPRSPAATAASNVQRRSEQVKALCLGYPGAGMDQAFAGGVLRNASRATAATQARKAATHPAPPRALRARAAHNSRISSFKYWSLWMLRHMLVVPFAERVGLKWCLRASANYRTKRRAKVMRGLRRTTSGLCRFRSATRRRTLHALAARP